MKFLPCRDCGLIHDGWCTPMQRQQTALTFRYGRFETVPIDDNGKIIEPCRKCGPVLACSDHWVTS